MDRPCRNLGAGATAERLPPTTSRTSPNSPGACASVESAFPARCSGSVPARPMGCTRLGEEAGPGGRHSPRDALRAPAAASHLRPPRPRQRHRPARHAQPSGQHQGRRHLALGREPLLGPARPPRRHPRWGCPGAGKGGHWLSWRPQAGPSHPIGRAPGLHLPLSAQRVVSFTPLAPPPLWRRDLFIPLAISASSWASFSVHWLRPLVRVKVPSPLGPLSSFPERSSHSIGRFKRRGF